MLRILGLQKMEQPDSSLFAVAWSTMSDHCNSGASIDQCTNRAVTEYLV